MLSILSQSNEKLQLQKEITELESKFYRLMFELDLYNKFNKTYYLQVLNKTSYGFFAKVYLVPGVYFSELEKKVCLIEEGLNCLWVMKTEKLKDYGEVKIVTLSLDRLTPYENPCIRPHEMYLGLDLALNIIKNNNNKNCMFLIAGATGAGKTRFIYQILLSWILKCSPEEVELYISDIAKDEYINFKYVKHVKCYASELEELSKMMKYIKLQIEKRKKTIGWYRDKGLATNIEEYNKQNPKMKMSYMYILIDEFSILMPDKSDGKEEKQLKEEILDVIKRVEKIGRSLGIFAIICTQKTVKDELPSIVKNMSAVRISFRANDSISSEVILGNNSAVGIADRYAIYSLNGGDKRDYLFSPNLSTERLNELLKPHIDRQHKKVNIESELSQNEQSTIINMKTRKIHQKPHTRQINNNSPYPLIDTSKTRNQIEDIKPISYIKKEDDLIDY
ncbi:MAG TPA: FtsK/SpoIIIE domain-containing protein [Patescibacteria group bacterium]|nr:FtsK/SpoIIIE domain-containing protein [Patescibacteria group bacterium]